MLVALDAQITVIAEEQAALNRMILTTVVSPVSEDVWWRLDVLKEQLAGLTQRRGEVASELATMDGRMCNCSDWRKWERFLGEIRRRLGDNVKGLDFVGNEFRFCPWCGAPREER